MAPELHARATVLDKNADFNFRVIFYESSFPAIAALNPMNSRNLETTFYLLVTMSDPGWYIHLNQL